MKNGSAYILAGLSALTISATSMLAKGNSIDTHEIYGQNLLNQEKITSQLKSTVVIFLSANCPCSKSHEALLKKLVKEYPQTHFIGVHSNSDEDTRHSSEHFKEANLPFKIIQDDGSRLADQFKAFKTPHAFVYNSTGELVYVGGVTDSHEASHAQRFFLKEVLESLKRGEKPAISEGRTLGCIISRKG